MGESIISICMSFLRKTKYNMNARKNLVELFNRPSLKLKITSAKPCTLFCLKPQQGKEVMHCICDGRGAANKHVSRWFII
jgi:hypothetical protein